MTGSGLSQTTTKVCPHCGNTQLAQMRSLNMKACLDCPLDRRFIPWYVEEGQQSLINNNRAPRMLNASKAT